MFDVVDFTNFYIYSISLDYDNEVDVHINDEIPMSHYEIDCTVFIGIVPIFISDQLSLHSRFICTT